MVASGRMGARASDHRSLHYQQADLCVLAELSSFIDEGA
jgi:hypothetical protein